MICSRGVSWRKFSQFFARRVEKLPLLGVNSDPHLVQNIANFTACTKSPISYPMPQGVEPLQDPHPLHESQDMWILAYKLNQGIPHDSYQ